MGLVGRVRKMRGGKGRHDKEITKTISTLARAEKEHLYLTYLALSTPNATGKEFMPSAASPSMDLKSLTMAMPRPARE